MIHIKLSMSFPESGTRYQANLSPAVLFLILFKNVEKPRTLTMHHDLRPYPLRDSWDKQPWSPSHEQADQSRNKLSGTIR